MGVFFTEEHMSLSNDLLVWYDRNRREFPWRGTKDPYRIWLSEIMLQQTRTETVIRYYHRFLEAFPTVNDLAAAPEDAVLKLWEGLGYYSRARNLHAAAKRIAFEMGGCFPETAEGLRSLPGVGPYAANAVASIAYDECVPALDGNQARVLTRVLAHDEPLKTPFDLLAPALELISRDRPGDYNQALMDLGASICTPKNPKCDLCPIAAHCRAFEEGEPESYPRKKPPVAKKELDVTVVIPRCGNRLFIRKRPAKGLLAGMYEFCILEGHPSLAEIPALMEEEGFSNVHPVCALPDSKHVFTHLVWRMKGALVDVKAAPEGYIAVENFSGTAISSAIRCYREIAEELLAGNISY